MTQAKLAVTLPDHVWVQHLSTRFPGATFSVHAAVPGSESGFALVEIRHDDVETVLAEMADHPQLTEVNVVDRREDGATVHFETTHPLLLFSSRESGVPIELPVEIRDGVARVTVSGSRDRLSALVRTLEEKGFAFEIEQLGDRAIQPDLLSERQRELLFRAVDAGYYDHPRRTTLTELAEAAGIAKSTCSETLHRAEGAVIKDWARDRRRTGEASPLEPRPSR